jgi:8-oxo-dGTP pyrophosphatase MutT (NUDIX family)
MKSKRVAAALITDDSDNILIGKRNDNGKYTNPAGKANVNEDIYDAMVRELKEETGLDAIDLSIVKVKKINDMLIYLFKVTVDKNQKIDTSKDPDKECLSWDYIDPNDVVENLHIPLERNVLLQYWANN